MAQFDRITQQPGVMVGKAGVKGTRLTVGAIVGQIGAGHSVEQFLKDYPYLEKEDPASLTLRRLARRRTRSHFNDHMK
jgi:uncharacterized protein (DUF433 family)